jgi:hypothetical protein
MRRWLAAASAAGAAVGDRPATWAPASLAWLCTVGWLPLVVGVTPPPSEGDLVFLGARIFGSAIWPWNAVAIAAGALAITAMALVLAAVGEAFLLDEIGPRRRGVVIVPRLLGVASVTAVPAVVALAILSVALLNVAPGEFSAPDDGAGPIVRTVAALSPFLVLLVATLGIGGALYAAATRLVHARGDDALGALAGSPRMLRSAGPAALVHLAAAGLSRIGLLVVSAALLRVLWEPVGARLAIAEIDAVTAGLLVGFVAIWLCLVVAGGAVHAWASAGWSVLLTGRVSGADPDRRRQESPIDR